jgi:hypothetical protein
MRYNKLERFATLLHFVLKNIRVLDFEKSNIPFTCRLLKKNGCTTLVAGGAKKYPAAV